MPTAPEASRHGEQVIPCGEDVVERAAALGQQLAKDAGDAARPPAAGEHVRRDRDVARCGHLSRDPLVVGPVADRIVNEHHAGKRSTAVGNTAQRVDWPAGGVDRDGFHVINLKVASTPARSSRAEESCSLVLREATPDSERLLEPQGVVATLDADLTHRTDGLRPALPAEARLPTFTLWREERRRILAAAARAALPRPQ